MTIRDKDAYVFVRRRRWVRTVTALAQGLGRQAKPQRPAEQGQRVGVVLGALVRVLEAEQFGHLEAQLFRNTRLELSQPALTSSAVNVR